MANPLLIVKVQYDGSLRRVGIHEQSSFVDEVASALKLAPRGIEVFDQSPRSIDPTLPIDRSASTVDIESVKYGKENGRIPRSIIVVKTSEKDNTNESKPVVSGSEIGAKLDWISSKLDDIRIEVQNLSKLIAAHDAAQAINDASATREEESENTTESSARGEEPEMITSRPPGEISEADVIDHASADDPTNQVTAAGVIVDKVEADDIADRMSTDEIVDHVSADEIDYCFERLQSSFVFVDNISMTSSDLSASFRVTDDQIRDLSDSITRVENDFSKELSALEAMGFTNRKLNASVLHIHDMDVDLAAKALERFAPKPAGES
jgi:hypothetical protein